jgi:hypothetical protein
MKSDDFLDSVMEFPSKSIIQLYINIEKLKKFLDLTFWAFHIFEEDFLQHNPDTLDDAPVNLRDWRDAGDKLFDVLYIMYNQFYIALFGYVETFIDDLIGEIYSVFFKDLKNVKMSNTGDTIISILKKEKHEDFNSSIDSKFRLLKSFANWNNSQLDDIRFTMKKYRTIRNTIAHSVGKIKNMRKVEHILSPEIIQKDQIQLNHETFNGYSEGLLKFCIRINNDIVKNQPRISEFINKK